MTRRTTRCLCAALVASLLAFPAWAQGSLARFFGGTPRPSQPPSQAFVVTDQPRSSEIAVELAWLSDGMTFPYALTARNMGNALHVQGFVPSEAVRQRALFLAKRNTTMPVYDATKIHAGLTAPQPVPSATLPGNAAQALRSAFPEQSKNLRVSAGNNGSIIVAGMVGSYEEKLAISQALRQVPGCTGVANTVQVSGASYGYSGQPQNMRSAPAQTGTPILKNVMAFLGFGQNPYPNQPNDNYDPHNGSTSGTMIANGPNGQPYHGDYTSSSPPITEIGGETSWRTSSPAPQETSGTMQVIAATHENNPAPRPRQVEPPLYGEDGRPVIARSDKVAVEPAANLHKQEPPLFGNPEAAPIVRDSGPMPASLPQQAAGPKLAPQQLKKRIESVCGSAARNVSVGFEAGKLAVRMELVEGARQEQIIDRVLSMPEMTPYQEQLQLSLQLPSGAPQQTEIINEPAPRP